MYYEQIITVVWCKLLYLQASLLLFSPIVKKKKWNKIDVFNLIFKSIQ